MDDLHFGFTSPAHACIMIYVHELKIKLLKSKFECCPVFQLWQILVPWNSDEFLSRLPSELQSWFVHTPKSLEFPLRLFSPICAWKGKTYRHTIHCMIRTYREYFFIRLFLFQTDSKFFRRATTFYHILPENVVVRIMLFINTSNKNAYSSSSSRPRIELLFYSQCSKITLHMLLRGKKFNQVKYIFFRDKLNVNSSLVCLNCWRAVTYPPLFSPLPLAKLWRLRRAPHC